jgi:hypothetical protein
MPIRPEWRRFYGREWRELIRPRILARAGSRCERCGKPDRCVIWTTTGRRADGERWMCWRLSRYQLWRDERGQPVPLASSPRGRPRRVRVILTVAHLNHDPRDNRDTNLVALCQWCHLNYDRPHHRQSRAARKDAARPLLRGRSDATMPDLRLHG